MNRFKIILLIVTICLASCAKHPEPITLQQLPIAKETSQIDSSLIKKYEAGQCKAMTKKGIRCKRRAAKGSDYCWQHQK